MFYDEILYFFLALILWGAWPVQKGPLPASQVLILFLSKEFLWLVLVQRLLATAQDSLQFVLRQRQILKWALFFLFLDVALLHLPAYLVYEWWGILFYLHYLFLSWALAARLERRHYLMDLSRGQYISSQLKLLLPLILPWFLAQALENLLFSFKPDLPEALFWPLFLALLGLFFPYLAVKFWPTRKFPPTEMRQRIEGLLQQEKVKVGQIYLWLPFEGRLLTAGVMGLFYPFRYLLISPGLLSLLSEAETLSVIAHEIGHVKHRHIPWLLSFLIAFVVLVYYLLEPAWLLFLALFPFPEWFFSSNLRFRLWPEIGFILFLGAVVVLYFRYLLGFVMRNFERQADLYALKSLGSVNGLITSLEKIASVSGLRRAPSWHHFSIEERIRFLQSVALNPQTAQRHHTKVRRILTSWTLLVVLGLALGFSPPAQNLRHHALKNVYEGLEKKAEAHPEWLRALGDFLLSQGWEAEALRVYEKALKFAPQDPWLLNNLAWLLLTAQDPALREPQRALLLAQKAAQKDPSPEVLDTLAEAYHQNGKKALACQAAREALKKAQERKKKIDYYHRRKRKFCSHVEAPL